MTIKDFKKGIFGRINKTKEMFIYEDTPQEDKFFSDIFLYDDLKQLLSSMLVSKESVHCVLAGPPASGKTMFLESIQ